MYNDLIKGVNELLSIDTREFLILDDSITSNKNSLCISSNLKMDDPNYVEQFTIQIKHEIYRSLYKSIFKEMKFNNKFLDLRNFKFPENLNETSLFLSQFKYKNLLSNGRILSELQDSLSFHFSKIKSNPVNDIYGVGKYLDFKAYVDPYLRYSDEEIYLFDDIQFNINNFRYDVISESTFTPRLKVSFDFYFEIGDNEMIYVIDDDFQKSLLILISQMRDEKIDQLLGE